MPDPVLLFHGLSRTARSMRAMARALERAGFEPHNVGYASTCAPVERLVETAVAPRVDALLDAGAERVHFVTHSLGGVLVRALAARRADDGQALPPGCRAVMLAPPHGGSEVADAFDGRTPFRWWCGPAFGELGTGAGSVPRALGPVRGIEAGVIAGTRRIVPFDRLFEGPNDGLVSVESATAVAGLADTVVVPYTHALMMRAPAVLRQTVAFLRDGRFAPTA